jgi:hypothetical protein
MIGVADLTNRRHAALVNEANLTTWQANLSVNALFRQQLRGHASRTG